MRGPLARLRFLRWLLFKFSLSPGEGEPHFNHGDTESAQLGSNQ